MQTPKTRRIFAPMNKITEYITSFFARRKFFHTLVQKGFYAFDWKVSRYKYGETIFKNIIELVTDLYSEVSWFTKDGVETEKFRAWRSFLNKNGQRLLSQLYVYGYAVIAWRMDAEGTWVFWQLRAKDYEVITREDDVYIEVKNKTVQYYVLRSPSFEAWGKSDQDLCEPAIRSLDSALNASNTVCERMGVLVAASPKDPSNAPAASILTPDEKQALEDEMQKNYGALRHQNTVMLLPRPMDFQIINLVGLDQHLKERVNIAILEIVDRIKVPANQVAIIDANSSKSLANGTELREGDLSKYRTFRRLLNATLYDFGIEIGLNVDYSIENEPRTIQGQTIENPTV